MIKLTCALVFKVRNLDKWVAFDDITADIELLLVEAFRPGYPRFSALISTHPAFQLCRRFTRTRMRLLLLKQDEITLLEDELDRIDCNENKELFLVSSRRDRNPERKHTVESLEAKLAEYGRRPSIFTGGFTVFVNSDCYRCTT